MGALCQSVLLMEPYFRTTPAFDRATLVRHLEMLGRTSGHVRYYEPYVNPPAFRDRVQSDAIQNYADTTLVSALLETDPGRQHALLLEAQRVFTDSLKVIPGWADTIKPDFTGFITAASTGMPTRAVSFPRLRRRSTFCAGRGTRWIRNRSKTSRT